MADKVKVSILELNGQEFAFATERLLTSDIVDYDPTISGLTATDAKAAIDELALGGISDGKDVKVSANDTTPGFLEQKIVAGSTKVSITTLNDGGDEDLSIDVVENQINHDSLLGFVANEHLDWTASVGTIHEDNYVKDQVKVSSNDTTRNYIVNKIIAGLGISITEDNDGSNETLSIVNNSGNFGTEFFDDEDETESSTTSITYVEKLKLTTVSLPAGDYVFYWFYEAKTATGSNKSMDVRVQLDDTDTVFESTAVDSRGEWMAVTGFDFLAITAGVHVFDIDYRKNASTANIRRARIIGWRIH